MAKLTETQFKQRYSARSTQLNWLADPCDFEQAKRYLRIIGEWNDFEAENVIRAFEFVTDYIAHYTVGREYSPVVYLTVRESEAARLPGILDDLTSALADERHVDGNRIRLWWD